MIKKLMVFALLLISALSLNSCASGGSDTEASDPRVVFSKPRIGEVIKKENIPGEDSVKIIYRVASNSNEAIESFHLQFENTVSKAVSDSIVSGGIKIFTDTVVNKNDAIRDGKNSEVETHHTVVITKRRIVPLN